jgi:hypothetical protein
VINAGSPSVKAGTEATPLLLILMLPLAMSFLVLVLSAFWQIELSEIKTKSSKKVILIFESSKTFTEL